MITYDINTSDLKELCPKLRAGDKVILSGKVFTSRDAAHQRIFALLNSGEPLPYSLENAVIYYAGPTPAPDGLPIGSCGPTTSSRMDPYTSRLYDLGVIATIGKGERNEQVVQSIKRNKAVYLCAIGGAGALAAMHISECRVIAFDDLGCESVKELTFDHFPLIVGIDANGGNIFNNSDY